MPPGQHAGHWPQVCRRDRPEATTEPARPRVELLPPARQPSDRVGRQEQHHARDDREQHGRAPAAEVRRLGQAEGEQRDKRWPDDVRPPVQDEIIEAVEERLDRRRLALGRHGHD
jgi:hypothetical protein